ncbi:glycosyltransferase family A protein [Sphingosinicella sp. LHD-64]|uniref:glycosyltransferase family 2 protein n=1 Tax=Sphingosinicella sp. LHD-64 TaxID=3072139 RepID=UPI00280DC880|nr:glycosyltransferase family A protein [Sphingosinicella sp. LHD-64]MDQ8755443.1 glycosyltransferase family A protein [Sphingosinicella sp. LHD-64]
MSPRFSVIIPVHNKVRHVAATVESALAQSYAAHEVIVIDDASTDGSSAILARLDNPRIVRLRREVPGPGGYAARNLGIEQASGDWIAFLDADDLWEPDHLASLAEAIARHPEAGCAATRFTHVFADRQQTSKSSPLLAAAAETPADLEAFLRIWLELGECPVWTGAGAFRRQVLLDAGLFPAGLATRGGDKDLWLRAAAQARFVHVPRPTVEFHRDADNKVSKTTRTTGLPILVRSAQALMAGASPAVRGLLRRLVNQQIGLYARFAFRSGGISPDLRANIYLPEGLATWLMVRGIEVVPNGLRRRIYGAIKHRDTGALAANP